MNAQPEPRIDPTAAYELSERDRAMLAFEGQWFHYSGTKEQAIRDAFGVGATRYYQLLNALIERREALVADPMTVKRLLRLREQRRRSRAT